ncbi:MAG TPA: right-handed parallel beta-helix repeat-containing protein [Pseudomonadales bacterium]
MKIVRTVLALYLAMAGALASADAPEPAALPEQSVDTAMPANTATPIAVRAGDSFQAALDSAQPGDVIELEAGAEFRGPFTLPNKQGEGWIVVRSAQHANLPEAGTRIEPAHAASMPVLTAEGEPVLATAPGAHHFRFIGIEIRPVDGSFIYNLVELGDGTDTADEMAHHIVFDRCYLHGDPQKGARRGIAMNSAHTAVIDSWLSDFKEPGADSQAIAGWGGPGPFLIRNNHLEGAGENIMFGGGGRPGIEGLVPSDIEIRGNYMTKPLAWKADHPDFDGTQWSIKNLFELKNARRVLVEGNVFENNWAQAQNGMAILFTVRNEDGIVPWATIEDVTFTNNVIANVPGGVNILARDDGGGEGTGRAARIVISNNLFRDMRGGGHLFQILGGPTDLTIERNTALNPANIIMTEGDPTEDLRFAGNIVRHNEYGIIGSGTGPGLQTIDRYMPGAEITGNVIVGGNMRSYPEGNDFPVSMDDVGFADSEAGDFRVSPSSRRGNTITAGADIDALCSAFAEPERARQCGPAQQ